MMYFGVVFYLVLLQGIVYSRKTEPSCFSRYDFEEKLLEKAVRTEMLMQEYVKKLDEAMASIAVSKEQTAGFVRESENKFNAFKTDIESQLNETLGIVNYVADNAKGTTVIFNARNAANKSPASGQSIVFDTVISNIGNAYDASTGIFSAPIDGAYVFGVKACLHYEKILQFQMVVDSSENVILAMEDYEASHWSSPSHTVPIFLTKGQRVWVQSLYSSTSLYGSATCWNQFSGLLVHT